MAKGPLVSPAMITSIAGLVTALLETGAAWYLIEFKGSPQNLSVYFVTHAAASTVLAWMLLRILPERYREPEWPVFGLLFSFAFFIPLLGIAGMLAAVVITALRPKAATDRPFEEVVKPEYVLSIREPGAQLRISSLKSMLLDPNVPAEMRLRSLNALQNMPTRAAAPTLRRLLGDPLDELRLIAYGMLDQKEKRINSEIQSERKILAETIEPMARVNVLRRLVELNWELIYSDLVQGDVRAFHLAQVADYAGEALVIVENDPGLWFLRGRGLQASGRFDEAREAYTHAIDNGLPRARALAYLAEIAFEQRDFVTLREHLAQIAQSQPAPVLVPLIRFWNGTEQEASAHFQAPSGGFAEAL